MSYKPNDPEFYRYLKAGMPADGTLERWRQEGQEIHRQNWEESKDGREKEARRAYNRAWYLKNRAKLR